jgi:mercuric ion binding protein
VKKLVAFAALAVASSAIPIAASAGERTITLAVDNMVCVVCALNVKSSLESVPGVVKVRVALKQKIAIVVYDDAKTDVTTLTSVTARVGFPSAPKN